MRVVSEYKFLRLWIGSTVAASTLNGRYGLKRGGEAMRYLLIRSYLIVSNPHRGSKDHLRCLIATSSGRNVRSSSCVSWAQFCTRASLLLPLLPPLPLSSFQNQCERQKLMSHILVVPVCVCVCGCK